MANYKSIINPNHHYKSHYGFRFHLLGSDCKKKRRTELRKKTQMKYVSIDIQLRK